VIGCNSFPTGGDIFNMNLTIDPGPIGLAVGGVLCILMGIFETKRSPRNRVLAILGGLLCFVLAYVVLNIDKNNH
jgi:drug/metabolite transporter (DMT)-like permease